MNQRIYIAGPMTGLPDYNYPAFNAAAAMLRAQGYAVENPAENSPPTCGTWQGYMRLALAQLMTCDTIYILAGWMNSKGARIEARNAYDLGMNIRFSPDALLQKPGIQSIRELIQDAADAARNATRAQSQAIQELIQIAVAAGKPDVAQRCQATLSDLVNRSINDFHALYINPLRSEPVAVICPADHDTLDCGQWSLKVLRDLSEFGYGAKLVVVPKEEEC